MDPGTVRDVNAARSIGLLIGLAADGVLGDPRHGHPVAAFGKVAQRLERSLYRDGRASGVANRTRGVLGVLFLVQVGKQHVGTFPGERQGDGAPDAGISAGDQRDSAFQFSAHEMILLPARLRATMRALRMMVNLV